MILNPNSIFRPSTFEERGTAAPFTTPILSLSRVRPDEWHRLVLLMPSFSGSDGAYVVPWDVVPQLTSMSIHDRALHEEISVANAVTPDLMRRAALKVAMTGLAGAASAEAAAITMAADDQMVVETNLLLMLALMENLQTPVSVMMGLDPKSAAFRTYVKTMMREAVQEIGLRSEIVDQRIAELAAIIAPIGFLDAGHIGRLRRLLAGVAEFRQSIADWGHGDRSDMAGYAGFAATVADLTIDIAGRMLMQIDRDLRQIGQIIRQWDKRSDGIKRMAGRLSWLLDGWDFVLAFWQEARGGPMIEQRDSVDHLMRLLPLVPRHETSLDVDDLKRRQALMQRRRLRAYEDWRTGERDIELVARMEAAKLRGTAL